MPKLINQILSLPHSLNYIYSSKESKLDPLLCLSLALFPLLYMTLRGWTNYFVFILLVLAIVHFLKKPKGINKEANNLATGQDQLANWAIVFTLASPILAIFLSQSFRQSYTSTAFDGPSRFLLLIPVFFYLKDRQINFTKMIEWIIPISLLICLGAYLFNPEASEEWFERAATYFVDPNTFGVYCLILGFLCLSSIGLNNHKEPRLLLVLKLIGFLVGTYIALKSQSRSAWTTAIALIFLVSFIRLHKKHPIAPWLMLLASILSLIGIYYLSPVLQDRISMASNEIKSYLNNEDLDTSVGLRISMVRVGIYLMLESPLSGLKDGIMPALDTISSIKPFYTEELQTVITEAGIHLEILAQGVRAGIFGLISGTALFLVPGIIFWKKLKSPDSSVRNAANLGLVLVIGLFIAGLTIQVFNLKYTSSFYALMITALAAQALKKETSDMIKGSTHG